MYKPLTIANFFIEKGIETGEPISQMKVQKLVYIAHGWYLAVTNQPLIRGVVEAWKFGPVIPDIYHKLKAFGNEPICDVMFLPGEKLKKEDKEFLSIIWIWYGKYTAGYLSSLTHQSDTPWDKVAKQYDYDLPKNKDIDNDLIRDHYVSIKSKMKVSA